MDCEVPPAPQLASETNKDTGNFEENPDPAKSREIHRQLPQERVRSFRVQRKAAQTSGGTRAIHASFPSGVAIPAVQMSGVEPSVCGAEPDSRLQGRSRVTAGLALGKIEDLIFELKQRLTVVIVTHNMQQAARVAEFTGFFLLGKLIEFDKTETIFTKPSDKRTEDYITGRFG